MSLTKKDVQKIAQLARIRLTEKEEGKMAKDLGAILGYIEKLNSVNTDGVEPMGQVTGLENILRPDDPSFAPPSPQATDGQSKATEDASKLINQFPQRKDNHLKVKEVFSDRS
ncbi:MAG: Asp-tRNA(Asn)/Glu-tRNA(Gln) amidotransferase subunit GatC [bacterium]|nr:Asp-tRNA(Asn)/Glu-tRNA(Gln) amidotransferase subunit GatC [bacterium]